MPNQETNRSPITAPWILVGSRFLFTAYFATLFGTHVFAPHSILAQRVPLMWCAYLFFLYIASERIYAAFKKRKIDLTVAFPMVFSVFVLNIIRIQMPLSR